MSSSLNRSSEEDAEAEAEAKAEQLRRGPWTLEEDSLLSHYIARHGEGRWNLLAKRAGLRRTGKSCRLRWLNYLKPDVKRGNLTPQEQFLILELHSKWGNRWSKIAQQLPGRTDNEIKNYWRTRMQKQARHLKIDPNSAAFQNVVRCLWMPRLLQKMEGGSSSVTVPPQSLNQTTSTSQHQPLMSVQQLVVPTANCLSELAKQDDLNLHHQDHNSDSEQCATSSCVSSSESMNNNNNNNNMSQIVSQLAEYQTSSLPTNGNHDYNCYYDMETIDQLASTSALSDFENPPIGDCHVACNNWVGDGFADGIWSMGELWELRNFQ